VLPTKPTDSSFLKDVKKRISEDLGGRIQTLKRNKTLLAACALDPRFKRLSFLSDSKDRDAVWAKPERGASIFESKKYGTGNDCSTAQHS
jgi:hypothetical protein